MLMPLLARIGLKAMGPMLVPLLVVGLLFLGGLAIKEHDTRIATTATTICNAGWEGRIRDDERRAAAVAISEAQALARNTANTAERLQDALEESNSRLAEYDAAGAGSADNCASSGLLDSIGKRWSAGPVPAGGKERAQGAAARPATTAR